MNDTMGEISGKTGRPAVLNQLTQLACEQGADRAAIISTSDIHVEDRLADLCRHPRCEVYGLSASCPPHVGGPSELRKLLAGLDWAIFFKIDVPTDILLSEERRHVYKLLHEIAAGIEQAAIERGWPNARAFAGGSCKKIFCGDHADCRVVDAGNPCRHPHHARPSMSGYGINVSRLMSAAGWQLNRITRDTTPESVPMGAVSGLVLVG